MLTVPFSEARAHLADTLREVEHSQQPVLISRRGDAAGVLMSLAQYRQLSGGATGFATRLAQWRADNASAPAEVDEFADLRDPGSGRDFTW